MRANDDDDGHLLRYGFVWLLAAFSSAGGLFQGYAIGLVTSLTTSSTFDKSFPKLLPAKKTPDFVLVFLMGCAGGALATGVLPFGRKRSIIGAAALGVVAGVLMAAAPARDVVWLYVTRFLSGLSVGGLSVLVPLYQSEVAPAPQRGRLMATFQLAVTLGIMCAFTTDFVLSQLPDEGAECERYALCQQRWRLVLALQILPCFVLALGMPLLPESPRWLMMRGGEAAARRALINIRKASTLEVLQELHEMKTYARFQEAAAVGTEGGWVGGSSSTLPAGDSTETDERSTMPRTPAQRVRDAEEDDDPRAANRRSASQLALRISGMPPEARTSPEASWHLPGFFFLEPALTSRLAVESSQACASTLGSPPVSSIAP